MLPTIVQWIHVSAAVIGVGGIGFLVAVLLPSGRVLQPDQRDLLFKTLMGRFRWVSWSVMGLLLVSGIYNVGQVWEMPWGTYWRLLTLKMVLAMLVFCISLTLPLKFFDFFRARRKAWLSISLALAMIVILISAYLRRG